MKTKSINMAQFYNQRFTFRVNSYNWWSNLTRFAVLLKQLIQWI